MNEPAAPAPVIPALPDVLLRPVAACLAAMPAGARVGVAVSGGPDSLALAAVAATVARRQSRALTLLHVHHGLIAQADAWAEGVMQLAAALGAEVAVRRVQVARGGGDGLEAAAREARYAALADMAREAGLADLLLAHHLDDQAETVMIRLLRGAGPTGLGAMRKRREQGGVRYHRPWLGVERATVLPVAARLAHHLAIPLVDDPSNQDRRHARGALRTAVLPAVAAHWPGYRQTLARLARVCAETAAVLDEVAIADMALLRDTHPRYGTTLSLAGWRTLSSARRALVLRHWLAEAGAPMPSEARLDQICHQLDTAAVDRQVLLQHGEHRLRVYRGRILLEASPAAQGARGADPVSAAPMPSSPTVSVVTGLLPDTVLSWGGELQLPVPGLGGVLCFESAPVGVDPAWLAGAPLRIGLRRGRERLRPGADRPSRSLKNLYQEAGIPAWERPRLPLVWRGATLVYAAALGLDARIPQVPGGLQLRWQPDAPGATGGHRHDNSPRNAG